MKKLALTAGAVLVATALTGASTVSAAGDPKVHTKRFIAHESAGHAPSQYTFVGVEVDRHAGHIIGYNSFSGRFDPKTQDTALWLSFALKGGTIAGVIHFPQPGSLTSGQIRNGTGKYKGIDGTITERPVPGHRANTRYTLTYHF
jgi:hypothetical protein